MNIVFKILAELEYIAETPFTFEINDDMQFDAYPFVSLNYPSQVFLVVELKYSQLNLIRNGEFMPNLANEFCRQDFHKGEMDKNISLIIKSIGSEEELSDDSEKIKIEDDPYYFKKYVFACTEQREKKAIEYFMHMKSNSKEKFSYVSEVQDYLLKADMFEKYKGCTKNEEVYAYMVELATKLPIIPLKVISANEIKKVSDYFEAYMKNNEFSLNVNAIEKFIFSDVKVNEDNLGKILDVWQACLNDKGIDD